MNTTPTPDRQNKNNNLPPSYVQSINLSALQKIYPVISSVLLCCGTVEMYTFKNGQSEEKDRQGIKGPLFLVQTQLKTLWLVILNQDKTGSYRWEINENTKYSDTDRSLTVSTSEDNKEVQFCFISTSDVKSAIKSTLDRIRSELDVTSKSEKLLKQAMTYCSN